MKSQLFVASTLPISFIDKLARDGTIGRVFLINKTHLSAYKYLQKNNPTIRLICLPTGFIKHFMSLLAILLLIKIKNERVIFFHECCWEVFDALLNIINIPSDYYPHVTLNSLRNLNCEDIPLTNKVKLFLVAFNQISRFTPYELQTDMCNKAIVWSCRRYPKKTLVHDLAEVWPVRNRIKAGFIDAGIKNILLVVGADLVDNGNLVQLYTRIGKMLVNRGYKVYIKDHPNYESRLNIDADSWAQIIDPNCPVEFLEEDFICAIGCASTGLASFKGRAISIIYMTAMGVNILESRVKHLNALFCESEIKYPRSEEMLLSSIDEFQDN